MARILRTDPFPTMGDQPAGARVVTLHGGVAAALNLPHLSLRQIAVDELRKRGISTAPRITARHTLKRAIASVLMGVDPPAEAARIRASLDIVLRTGIDCETLIEFGSPRVQNLGRITREYRRALEEKRLIDPAEVFIAAAALKPAARKLFIYGHFRARSEEAQFIDTIAADESEYYLPIGEDNIFEVNRKWADWLVARGWSIERSTADAGSTGEQTASSFISGANVAGTVAAVRYRSVDGECRGILREVKKLLTAGAPGHSIAIACADQSTYAPVLEEVATEFGIPLRFRNETPIGETAFGGFIRALLEAVSSDLSYEAAARLFKHRLGPSLESSVWKTARHRRSSGHEAWNVIGVDTDALRWPEQQNLSGWIKSIEEVVAVYGGRAALRADAKELTAYDLFFESLEAAAQLEAENKLSLDAFRATAFEILSEEKVPFRPEHGGVGVFDPEAMIGSSYETLFIAGLSEGIYPAEIIEDSVVDFLERRDLANHGVEFAGAAEMARWESLSFYFTLAAARDRIILSCASSMDNRELLASSFFDRLGLKPKSDTTSIAASLSENRRLILRHDTSADDAAIHAARFQRKVESDRESSSPYDEYDGVTGIAIDPAKHTWSASQLTMIGQCGFKWWGQRALKLADIEEVETGMDYTKRGTFYHKVLEIAARKAQGAENVREAVLANIDEAFAEAENDPETPLPMISNWDMQRAEHIRAIKKAVRAKDFIRYGSTIEDVEREFELTWRDFKLRGAIDRIDNTPEGLVAIDYKTSGSPPKGAKDDRGKLGIDVQIPLYAKVALPHLYPEGNFGESIYYSLTKGVILAPKKSSELAPVEQLLARVRGDLGRGSYAVDPDTNLDACQYCEFDPVCRKGPRLERKNTV
ncbi:MAG: PD-(D/E)XK nuclease family protein [Acidobacteria bacterium]|nr:PD-(D/E)XK nuclease family protein [Acidobacteriota bacterium]